MAAAVGKRVSFAVNVKVFFLLNGFLEVLCSNYVSNLHFNYFLLILTVDMLGCCDVFTEQPPLHSGSPPGLLWRVGSGPTCPQVCDSPSGSHSRGVHLVVVMDRRGGESSN